MSNDLKKTLEDCSAIAHCKISSRMMNSLNRFADVRKIGASSAPPLNTSSSEETAIDGPATVSSR